MFEQHKTLVQKYAHVKVPHLRKQPCLIALCAKVWGTGVFALAKGARRGAKKNTPHPSALFIPRVCREHRNTVARTPPSKPRCENVGGQARPGERVSVSVIIGDSD